ncbi:S-methyl-5-thioribose kinase [Rhodospirillum sp. A1_3_36]|uniref:S-methyl-5-thioribose kinase n=1 Tax=Rhodospirillum sp. A1_3_36 TaxID=3391666 RepID=UPI0039A73CAF
MEYVQLTVDNIAKYLSEQAEMAEIFSSFDGLDVSEIGDGNLNYVYRVTNRSNPEETVIVKQAVPFLRCVGEDWPLSRERMTFETMALRRQKELCPHNVPTIYHSCSEMSLVVMQNLKDHAILRGELIKGKVFPHLAEHASTFLADTLFFSSDFHLDHRTKKEQVAKFINIDLCKITEDFVFTHPFEDNETNDYNPELPQVAIDLIQRDPAVRAAVAEMKRKFMCDAEALLHGDLHTGSLMVSETETYVIDPEFAFYGPMGFDLGAFLANLILAYFSQDYWQRAKGEDPAPYRAWLLETIEQVWTGFDAKFQRNWVEHCAKDPANSWGFPGNPEAFAAFRAQTMSRLLSDTIGFAACKMMRRIVGLAKVAEIKDISDLKERAKAEVCALTMGSRMVVNRASFTGITDLTELAKEISPVAGG